MVAFQCRVLWWLFVPSNEMVGRRILLGKVLANTKEKIRSGFYDANKCRMVIAKGFQELSMQPFCSSTITKMLNWRG